VEAEDADGKILPTDSNSEIANVDCWSVGPLRIMQRNLDATRQSHNFRSPQIIDAAQSARTYIKPLLDRRARRHQARRLAAIQPFVFEHRIKRVCDAFDDASGRIAAEIDGGEIVFVVVHWTPSDAVLSTDS
jgi:hypothetical protein